MQARQLKIYGIVQGVFFRKHTQEKALELGIKGTVRNCSDGSVEVHAEGGDEMMQSFIQWCHIGPERASVLRVDIHETELKNYQSFVILRG